MSPVAAQKINAILISIRQYFSRNNRLDFFPAPDPHNAQCSIFSIKARLTYDIIFVNALS
jgi:hypothetical protein